jgi:hypothetical protein
VTANDKDGRERLCRYRVRLILANAWFRIVVCGNISLATQNIRIGAGVSICTPTSTID